MESYLTWCQTNSTANTATRFALAHVLAVIIIVLFCQVYIQYNSGINFACITIKHTFVAILLLLCSITSIFFISYQKLNISYVIPTNFVVVLISPMILNIGFLLKEHVHTFPIILQFISHPISVIVDQNEEMEMYSVHE